MRPLVFHVPDGQMEAGLRAFFHNASFHHKLGCAKFDIDWQSDDDFFRVPGLTDPGVYQTAHDNLRPFQRTHEHALVLLDETFPGSPGAAQIQESVSKNMRSSGWLDERFQVIVIQPMLEAWLWTDNQHVEKAFGHTRPPSLRQRMNTAHLWPEGTAKPVDLKAATVTAAGWGGKKSSAALFGAVFGSPRSLAECVEPGFIRLRETLQGWFPPTPQPECPA
jgi:hypothetical protein